MDGITNLMVNLIPIPATQANIPVIILDRPLAPMPIPFKNHRTDTRPIRIEPFITMGTRPRHNASTKTGLAGAEQENTPKGKHPSRKSSQINQPKCSGRESNPHTLQVAHFECAASTIPPPKQKNKHPTLHPQQEHGTLVQPPESHKEPMASSQWLFTASHGARMLRESNPRTPLGIATLARWCNKPLCQASKSKSRRSDSGDCSRRLGGSAKTRAATRRLRRPFPQPVGRLSTACWTRTNIDGFGDRNATGCTNAIYPT